jgi:hypothetical protein
MIFIIVWIMAMLLYFIMELFVNVAKGISWTWRQIKKG